MSYSKKSPNRGGGGEVEDMEFTEVLKKCHVGITEIN